MINLGRDSFRPHLPATALVVGAAALLGASIALLLQPTVLTQYVASPRMLALTHAFTLLFVTLVYAGTLQQLPAVMFVTKLVWPRLGYASLSTLAIGALVLVIGFGTGMRPVLLAFGGTMVCLALGAVLLQLLLTARTRPPKDPASRALITAVCYLVVTVVLGLVLAAVRARPGLAAALGYRPELHQMTGLLGAFLLGIGGSGQKLLSMFALAKGGPSWRLKAMAYLVHVCVAALVVGVVAGAGASGAAGVLAWVSLGALVAASALLVWEVVALLRRRLRKRLEDSVMRYVIGHAFLPVAGVLLLVGQREAATTAFLLGFVGLAVSGMLIKILSFLTWTAAYAAPRSVQPRPAASQGGATGASPGPSSPPLLRQLLRPELEPLTTWTLGGGAGLATLTMALSSDLTAVASVSAVAAAIALTIGAASQLAQTLHIVYRVSTAK